MEEKKYEEWQDLPMDYDENNPYTQRFTYPNGDIFYVEPVFHLKLQGFKMQRPESIATILLEMERIGRTETCQIGISLVQDVLSILQIAISFLTAIATTLGITSCMG